MNFRIADTFSDSLARLTGEEQKAVKMTAFDLQMNPSNPGLSFHKLGSQGNETKVAIDNVRLVRAIGDDIINGSFESVGEQVFQNRSLV